MALSQQDAAALTQRLQEMDQRHQALAATVEAQRAEMQAQRARGDQAESALTAASAQMTQPQTTATVIAAGQSSLAFVFWQEQWLKLALGKEPPPQ